MSRWLGARIGKRVRAAGKQREAAQKSEKKASNKVSGFKLYLLKVTGIMAKKKLEDSKQAQMDYHENLQGISEEIHPFSLTDNHINDAKKVEERLEVRAQAFEQIARNQDIPGTNKNVMKKFRNQFKILR